MSHNAVIMDEQTGEILRLWAVVSEDQDYPNEITSEPIDIGAAGGQLNERILADHIHHEPMILNVAVDLTGDPGRPMGTIGGQGYEIEQHQKLVAFVNRNTTFTYTSYIFVHQTANSDEIQPGLVLQFLAKKRYRAVKSANRPQNIIGARLQFQSVVITHGGVPITDPDEAYDQGEQPLIELTDGEQTAWNAAAAGIGLAFAAAATTALAGLGIGLGWAIAGGVATGLFVIGSLATLVGSVPRQMYRTRIGDHTFGFELRSNVLNDFCTFSMTYDGANLVRERQIVYGEDLLSGVTHSVVRGLHIVPLDLSTQATAVTPENLGRTVQLYVLQE